MYDYYLLPRDHRNHKIMESVKIKHFLEASISDLSLQELNSPSHIFLSSRTSKLFYITQKA